MLERRLRRSPSLRRLLYCSVDAMAIKLSIQQVINQVQCGVPRNFTPRTLDRWDKFGIVPSVTLLLKKSSDENRAVYVWKNHPLRRPKQVRSEPSVAANGGHS
jgi:hypothetical protein